MLWLPRSRQRGRGRPDELLGGVRLRVLLLWLLCSSGVDQDVYADSYAAFCFPYCDAHGFFRGVTITADRSPHFVGHLSWQLLFCGDRLQRLAQAG